MRRAATLALACISSAPLPACSVVSSSWQAVLAPTQAATQVVLHAPVQAVQAVTALLPDRRARTVRLPVADEDGVKSLIMLRICRPPGDGPSPLAVINHGGPARGTDRSDMALADCDSPPARWFLDHDYVVMLPLRRGYGESEGEWAQNPGSCASPDYVTAGLEGARDIDTVVHYALTLPFVRPDGVVVLGEDEGGWAVLGYASHPNPHVAALIDVAGGMGGRAANQTRRTCRPDLLVEAAAEFGKTARNRMLWIYPADDPVFSPELATGMHTAFTAAGGAAELAQPKDVGGDAHAILSNEGAEPVWAPLIAKSCRDVDVARPSLAVPRRALRLRDSDHSAGAAGAIGECGVDPGPRRGRSGAAPRRPNLPPGAGGRGTGGGDQPRRAARPVRDSADATHAVRQRAGAVVSARGYLVVFALRRGYGASTGPIAEASGPCDSPDYVHAGVEGARDVDAVVRWAAAQPYARPDGIVVAGQSTGAGRRSPTDAGPHPGVTGLISMAGGRGGHAFGGPRTYCRPERLVAAAGVFGATAHTPMLWVNAANDTFFDPDLTQAMMTAFTQAGGRAQLVVTPPFDDEGHRLFYGEGGATVWGPLFARYLDGAARVAARR